jgi:hypothetical protein
VVPNYTVEPLCGRLPTSQNNGIGLVNTPTSESKVAVQEYQKASARRPSIFIWFSRFYSVSSDKCWYSILKQAKFLPGSFIIIFSPTELNRLRNKKSDGSNGVHLGVR